MKVPFSPQSAAAQRAWAPLLLVVIALGLYIPTTADQIVTNDSHAAAVTAWRIATTGEPWLDGVDTSELHGTGLHKTWLVEGAAGHVVYNRTPGVILPAIPAYAVLSSSSAPESFEVGVGGFVASLLTALFGLVLFLALRLNFSGPISFATSLLFLVGTPAWSVGADALWTHTITLLAIALSMYFVSKQRWWLVGLSLALGILARPHLAVIAAVVGVYIAWRRRSWRVVAAVGLGSATGLVGLLVWNRSVFGSWSIRGGYGEYVTANLTATGMDNLIYQVANVVGFFFAPDRGLFVWTPVVILLLPSMMAHRKTWPDWVKAFALGGLVYSLLQLRLNSFQGGQDFYGYRHALELLLCITPALVLAFEAAAKWTRVAVGALLGLQVAAFAIGAAAEVYRLGLGETWTGNAYVTALADHPLAFGAMSAVFVMAGAAITYRGHGRAQTVVQPAAASSVASL